MKNNTKQDASNIQIKRVELDDEKLSFVTGGSSANAQSARGVTSFAELDPNSSNTFQHSMSLEKSYKG